MDERDIAFEGPKQYLAATIAQKKWELRIPALLVVVSAGMAWRAPGGPQWLWVCFACVFALWIVALALELRRLHRIDPLELWRQECRPPKICETQAAATCADCSRVAAMIQEGKYAEAEVSLDDLLGRARSHPLRACALNRRADLLTKTGRLTEAEKVLRQLLAERPSVTTFEKLGRVVAGEGRGQEAVEWFREALRTDARDGHEYFTQAALLGAVFLDWRTALARCDAAVRGEPRFVPGWLLKGDAHLYLHESQRAVDAYRRAAALARGSEQARKNIAAAEVFQEGCAQALAHKPLEALRHSIGQ